MTNGIVRLLEGNKENAVRQGIIWNMAASLAYSFQSAILLLIVTRVGGLYAAGVFSIAYSVSQMFASIGSYSMREYQVSDTNNHYGFDTYYSSRWVTVLVMLTVCLVYSLLHGYQGEKLVILMLLSIYRAVDGFDDLYHGAYQKQGRLDIAARILALRIIAASLVFFIIYISTHNIVAATFLLTATAIVLSFLCDHAFNLYFGIKGSFTLDGVKKLLFSCAPVCIGAFMYNYLVNSPKYAIDNILSEEMQSIFNILFMPVFVTAMLSQFVFKPLVFRMGQLWNSGDKKGFLRIVLRQAAIIVALAVVVVLGGALLGRPVLAWIYGVDLSQYRVLFIVLLLFGGVSALNAFGSAVLTIMRRQIFILVSYGIALVVDVCLMNYIVTRYQLFGAGLVYGLAMTVVLAVYIIVIAINILRTGGKDG